MVGNACNCLDDVANVGCLRLQLRDHANGSGLPLCGYADISDEPSDIGAGTNNQRLAGFPFGAADIRVLHLTGNGYAHLLECGKRFLSGTGGLFGAGCNLIAGSLQLFGCGRRLGDTRSQLSRCRSDSLGGLLLFGERPRLFALRLRLADGDSRCLSTRSRVCR